MGFAAVDTVGGGEGKDNRIYGFVGGGADEPRFSRRGFVARFFVNRAFEKSDECGVFAVFEEGVADAGGYVGHLFVAGFAVAVEFAFFVPQIAAAAVNVGIPG